jgi:hypothetical protein
MSATPVGYLYTPQQLMGSVKYGSGVLLGNWREDDALDEMRLMDYVEKRDAGDLVLLKQKGKLAPQLAPAALTSLPSDGLMRCGDVVLLKSQNNSGALAVSLGQHDASNDTYAVFACDASKAVTRNAIKISKCAATLMPLWPPPDVLNMPTQPKRCPPLPGQLSRCGW